MLCTYVFQLHVINTRFSNSLVAGRVSSTTTLASSSKPRIYRILKGQMDNPISSVKTQYNKQRESLILMTLISSMRERCMRRFLLVSTAMTLDQLLRGFDRCFSRGFLQMDQNIIKLPKPASGWLEPCGQYIIMTIKKFATRFVYLFADKRSSSKRTRIVK
jgi:hypothetical protein